MAFLGMRGTGDWSASERPENWRQGILRLYPNGSMPLTAIMSMMGSEKTDDVNFHWWTKGLPTQGGPAAGVFTDFQLSVAYVSGGVKGQIVYVQAAEAVVQEFKVRHLAKLVKNNDARYATIGKVVDRVTNGDNSYLAVLLLEDADATFDLDEVDYVTVAGNVNAQGATIPDAIAYNPVEHVNKTHIFRTALSITRTARRTRLRTVDAYKEAKRECLELHGIEIEKAFMDSVMSERLGDNGKPETTTRGLVPTIFEFASENVKHFPTDVNFTGDTWLEGGQQWINENLELATRFGSGERLVIAGSGAVLGLQNLVQASSQMSITPRTVSYGLKVGEWFNPFGTLFIKTHPLWSMDPSRRYDMMVFDPAMLRTRFVDDTFFKGAESERKNVNNSVDGSEEEYVSELGLEHHHEQTFAYWSGVGRDNTLT